MKANFITKLNTWLFVVPVLLILAAYFGIGIWFYFSGASYVLRDFHAAQLMTMLSDKKNSVELWIDVRKKALEEIAKSGVVTDSLQKLVEDHKTLDPAGDASEKEKKAAADDAVEAGQRISKYLEGSSQFRSISFLSAEGTVIWSTNTELTGREWPDKDIFIKGLGRSDVIAARLNPVAGSDGFLFSLPFLIKGEQGIQMLIIAQPNPADLAASLRVEKGFYETGKVSVIDASGNVVASKDMTDVGRVRYNVRPSGLEGVDYREGLYYSVSALKNEQLKLIATLASAEASKPLKPLLTVYLAFAGLVVVAILLQCLLIAPRLLERPLSKLAKATQSISDGDLRAVSIRKGYIGELKTLAEGFSQMVVDLNKKWSLPGGGASELNPPKTSAIDIFAAGVRLRLNEIETSLAEPGAVAEVVGFAAEIRCLIMTLDDLAMLVKIRDGSIKLTKKECSVCDILRDVERDCGSLVGGREVVLIVECPEAAPEKTFRTDMRLLKRVASAILRSAIRLTDVGTVTLMASFVTRAGTEYIEISVSDTGRGLEEAAIGKILKEGSYYAQYLDLCIGRDLAVMLGGGISLESMPGKGSLVAVVIAADHQAAETQLEENI